MNCNETRELLSLYIDNNLETEEMIEVENHLHTCDACKKEFDEILSVINIMENLSEVDIPTQFDARLKEELKKTTEIIKKNNKYRRSARYSSMAAIFLIGIFSIAMYNNINSGETNNIEQLPASQDAMKMMAVPILEDSSNEADQEINTYLLQLDELYAGQPYVLIDWAMESPQIYRINIQLEITSPTGDISYEAISYRGQDGELWKIE